MWPLDQLLKEPLFPVLQDFVWVAHDFSKKVVPLHLG